MSHSYKYIAIDRNGKRLRGRLDAANEPELESRVQSMGLSLITCQMEKRARVFFGRRRITRREIISFCFDMEQLTRAGVPILEGLGDIRGSMDNPGLKEIISGMISAIEAGKTLSEAMSEFSQMFDEVFINLIRAGEQSGDLTAVFRNLTESFKWQDELAAHTKKIVMYPAFVGAVVLGVVFFLMIYLVPQLVSFIGNMGEELPLHTRLLVNLSDFIISYWAVILFGPMLFFIMLRILAKRSARVRYHIDAFKLRLWIIGPILRKIILSRFATYFALLYASGVTVLASMKITRDISGNKVIAQALGEAEKHISEGKSMSDGIASVNLFPPLVLRMLKVGEETGGIDEALRNVSYFYNRDVKESIDRLQSMIEPAMTVFLGLILGWVMLSVLGPIYEIIGNISN